MIKNRELVTSHFGYWPEFADGKVMRFAFDYSGVIELVVHYIDAEKQKSGHIGFRFDSVSDVELMELRSENVIDVLGISGGGPHTVTIDACCGLYGTFMCREIEVLYVNA
jgi:hypothetical protein